jgi:hypothetical protein
MKAQDLTLTISGLCSAAAVKFIHDPQTLAIVEIVIAGIAGTIAIHKAEFLANDKGNGVEVQLPNWALALGLFGALFMRPLTAAAESQALSEQSSPAAGCCLFFYRGARQDGTGDVANGSIIGRGGWDRFTSVFSGGNGVIYAVDQQGNLLFYRDQTQNGTGQVANASVIGRGGWNQFSSVFSGGNGIIYTIDQQGDLLFYRDQTQNGTGQVANASVIGRGGWNQFKSVFSGGNGIIYAVDQQSNLVFYHDRTQNGTGELANGTVIGRGGWSAFNSLFSGGNGSIYGTLNLP